MERTSSHRYAPPWLFLLLPLPGGVSPALGTVVLPYLLTRAGMPVQDAGALLAVTMLPHTWKPLWAPLLDNWLRRRDWHVLAGALGALGVLLALRSLERGQHLALITAMVAVNIAAATSDNLLGSLCALTVRAEQFGRAASFYSAGQLCWGGLLGGLVLVLLDPPAGTLARLLPRLSLTTLGLGLAAMMLAATLLVRLLDDPRPRGGGLLPHLRAVLRESWRSLRAPSGWSGLLICALPLCTGAVGGLFGALAKDYGASAGQVALVTGALASTGSAIGAFLGGALADRMERRRAYLLTGLLLAGCSLGMGLSPARPGYLIGWGVLFAIGSGVAYATFYSFVFEMIAPGAATTMYGLLAAGSNLAIAYVTFLDGQFYRLGGRRGLLLGDAALGLVGVACVAALLRWRARRQPG